MIETHAHIYDDQFSDDREDMIKRAFSAGVEEIWMPNCNSETIPKMIELEDLYPNKCFSMMGLHPCYVNADYQTELTIVKKWLSQKRFLMIGEIGLDYFWDLSFCKEQEEVFMEQLSLAKKYNLPICIHSRNAKDGKLNAIQRCCDLIEEFGWKDLRGIFHCFSGNLEDAERIISLNFLLGIGGVITFKNGGLDTVLPHISINNIVLETDSPYLAPVPFRGKRNEVLYLDLIVKKLAEIKGVDVNIILKETTINAKSLVS
jgi:TatD DNase family protein